MVALIIMFYYALKLTTTNINAEGLKKRVTIRESEKKRTKGSKIYNNFLQMFKNL